MIILHKVLCFTKKAHHQLCGKENISPRHNLLQGGISMADKNTTQPKGLSKSLKTFFGIGDAGFSLMTNVESFYFMSFLTD